MNRAIATLSMVTLGTGGCVWYAHYQQSSEKARMHEGVLRDIAKEEEEKRRVLDAAMPVGGNGGSDLACESGVCALATKRIRVE
jgi:hypothetical protein